MTCADQLCEWLVHGLRGVPHEVLDRGRRLVLEGAALLAGGVAQVKNDIGNRPIVELAELLSGRELEMPLADRPGQLEGQIALVAKGELEHSGIVLRRTGGDRLDRRVAARSAGCQWRWLRRLGWAEAERTQAASPRSIVSPEVLLKARASTTRETWSILRPSTFTETFQMVLCAPLMNKGQTVVFGAASNPVNFVSVRDVARFVEMAALTDEMRGAIVDIGGTHNLSLVQFVDTFASAVGVSGPIKHIPRASMRLLSRLARPFNPTFARAVQAGVVMDTTDM